MTPKKREVPTSLIRMNDMVKLSGLDSYSQLIVPAEVGLAIFELMVGKPVYTINNRYEGGKTVPYIEYAESGITIETISPAQIFVGLENTRMAQEKEAAERAAKEAGQ